MWIWLVAAVAVMLRLGCELRPWRSENKHTSQIEPGVYESGDLSKDYIKSEETYPPLVLSHLLSVAARFITCPWVCVLVFVFSLADWLRARRKEKGDSVYLLHAIQMEKLNWFAAYLHSYMDHSEFLLSLSRPRTGKPVFYLKCSFKKI